MLSYDGGTKQTWADREDIETNDTADPPSSDNIPKPTHRLKFSFGRLTHLPILHHIQNQHNEAYFLDIYISHFFL